jgi:hypothetical protein
VCSFSQNDGKMADTFCLLFFGQGFLCVVRRLGRDNQRWGLISGIDIRIYFFFFAL